jgi:hypothetical protein
VRIIGSAVSGCLTLALWLVSAQPASAARWTLQLAPQPPESTSSVLTGVSCTSRRACTAVGHYQSISSVGGSGSTTVALGERWNGSSWLIQQTPSPVGSSLTGVSCTSRTACTAVGSDNGGLLAERWDGSRWSIQPVSAPKGLDPSEVPPLNAVSCVSRRVCVAVGGNSVVERWNGSRWSIQRAPKGGGLDGVSCTSARACTAVGANGDLSEPVALRWNGRRWTGQRIRIPNPYDYQMLVALASVSCASQRACVAVGTWSLGTECCYIAFAERWDGNRWSFVHARNPGPIDNWLSGVSCAFATTTCVAVGAKDDVNARNHLLTERWNGIRWSAPRIPAPVDSALDGVSCTSKTVCTAIGSYGAAALIARRT